jgi:hypothetical protein
LKGRDWQKNGKAAACQGQIIAKKKLELNKMHDI